MEAQAQMRCLSKRARAYDTVKSDWVQIGSQLLSPKLFFSNLTKTKGYRLTSSRTVVTIDIRYRLLST
jgi:hypothetical protein